MSNHTPGPWRIASGYIYGLNKRIAHICDMDTGENQAKANGHMLAATPEMLEALEHLLIDWQTSQDAMYKILSEPRHKSQAEARAESIIAKAKGKPSD